MTPTISYMEGRRNAALPSTTLYATKCRTLPKGLTKLR
jgi:hypothetical protein